MKLRAKAFSIHLAGSLVVLAVVLGILYVGWYRWPGWYLVGALKVAMVLALVDVGLGPLATFVVADPAKLRTELRRDIAFIVIIQVSGLIYGATTLWNGRPLFYTFSVDRLEVVQASDIDESEIDVARKENSGFVPSWTDLPRWVWAPLPADELDRERIIESSLTGGKDVIHMPKYYKSWEQGNTELRARLKSISDLPGVSKNELGPLLRGIDQLGVPAEQLGAILIYGRGEQAVAVFDRSTLTLKDVLTAGMN